MHEHFPDIAHRRPEANPESSQQAYIDDLMAHTATIPDLSNLPPYSSLSDDQHALLARYGANWREPLVGVTPLLRNDIIDPDFCKSINDLTSRLSNSRPGRHWYIGSNEKDTGDYSYSSNMNRYTSQNWEIAYTIYMRERRMFHAAFMQNLLTGEPVDDLVQAIGVNPDGSPVQVPSFNPNERERHSTGSRLAV